MREFQKYYQVLDKHQKAFAFLLLSKKSDIDLKFIKTLLKWIVFIIIWWSILLSLIDKK